MFAVSEPPRPPAAPAPPRPSGNLVAIVLSILALVLVVCFLAIWLGVRYLAQKIQVRVDEAGSHREVSIKTPVGSLEVSRDVDEVRLGLPVYPGARRVKDGESAAVNLDLAGKESVRILAAKFETPDALERVKAFYQERLGTAVTKFVEKDTEGRTVFEIKREGLEKLVALEGRWSGTYIQLVSIRHGPSDIN